ncbi:MAG: phenylacetate--CoA ligase family protein [Gemmataceae bacterium]
MQPIETFRSSLWILRQYFGAWTEPHLVRMAQKRQLRRLLKHTRTHSPFYRDKFRHLDPACDDIRQFPPTTKAEMMANFDRVVTDPAIKRVDVERFIEDIGNVQRLFLGKYHVSHTSGSQGQPTLIVQENFVLKLLFGFQMTRGNVRYHNAAYATTKNLVNPTRLAVIINRQGFFPSAWVWKWMPESFRTYVRVMFLPANDPDLVAKLNDFSPGAITATPTTLDLLALKADQLRFPQLQQLVANSENLSENARERLISTFHAPVMNNYACGECVFLTNGCPKLPGAHVNADWAILEIVDDQYRPVPYGQLGTKVLVTNLANRVQPFIRYEVGDRVAMATEACGCGNRLPRVGQILGRSADIFWVKTPSGYRPLTTFPFQHALEYLKTVREWQAEQVERNRIVVHLEAMPGAVPDLDVARQRLDERVGTTGLRELLEIQVELIPRLSADPETGKLKRMVSRVGIPSDLDAASRAIATGSPR